MSIYQIFSYQILSDDTLSFGCPVQTNAGDKFDDIYFLHVDAIKSAVKMCTLGAICMAHFFFVQYFRGQTILVGLDTIVTGFFLNVCLRCVWSRAALIWCPLMF